jgi:hypothetical protein
VTSELEVGSTFRFTLPAAEEMGPIVTTTVRDDQDSAEIVGLPRVHPDVKTRRLAN